MKKERKVVAGSRETISENAKAGGYMRTELEKLMDAENVRRKEEAGDRQVPGQHIPEYQFFHLDEIVAKLDISAKKISEARKLIDQKEIRLQRVVVDALGSQNLLNLVSSLDPKRRKHIQASTIVGILWLSGKSDSYYGNRNFSVEMVFGQRELLWSLCRSWGCDTDWNYRRPKSAMDLCVHEVAGVLLFREYLEKHNDFDATTVKAKNLIRTLSDLSGETLTSGRNLEQKALVLEPWLEIQDDDLLHCTFRVGNSKLYKVKDIPDFCRLMENGGIMVVSPKTSIDLSKRFLTGESAVWYDFLSKEVRDEDYRRNRILIRQSPYERYLDAKIRDVMELDGERLDRFLEIAVGKTMPLTFRTYLRGDKIVCTIRDKALLPRLTIRPNVDSASNVMEGVVVEGKLPSVFYGFHSACWMEEGYLNRIGEKDVQALTPVMENAGNDNKISFSIGRMHLADFYHKALPQLRKIAEITETESGIVEEYLPPEPDFTIYLDIDNDAFLCRAEVAYGMEIFSLSDVLKTAGDASYPSLPGTNGKKESRTKTYQPYRDRQREEEIVSRLAGYFPDYDESLEVFYVNRDSDEAYDLLDHGLDELTQLPLCQVRMTDRFRRLGLRRSVKFDVGVSLESNLLDLSVTARELSEDEVLQVLYQYQKKRRFVVLKNGDFLKLKDNESLDQLVRMMEDLHLSIKELTKGKMHLPAYRALYLDKMLEGQEGFYADRDRHFKELIKSFKTVSDSDYEVPEHLKKILRPYQKEGYRWLRTLDHYGFGGILADEMGVGKTLQTLAVLEAVKKEEGGLTALVVCPASLVYNWLEEAHRFAPSLNAVAVTGTAAARAGIIHRLKQKGGKSDLRQTDLLKADLLITSYDLLKRDIAEYDEVTFRFEIIDEAQYIKTHTTAAAKSVKLIRAVTKFALTGTPIENRLSELWSIFDYLMPGFLFAYDSFRTQMEVPIVKNEDEEVLERLHKMIAPFILRRIKRDVLRDLPDKLEEIRYAGMESKQQKLYDAQVIRMRNDLKKQSDTDFKRSKIEILSELMKIRQICCDPLLCYTNYDGESAKTELCMELLRSLMDGGHRTLVFSQFTSMLEILEKRLTEEKIPYYVITGSTEKEERIKRVKAFNEGNVPVFLISLKAGGTGLNLVGADSVIHFDPWWNTAAENQASDRAHRIGQTKVVTVYKLVAKGTIEERILALQQQKAKLAQDVLSGEGVGSAVLSREDLMEILGGES